MLSKSIFSIVADQGVTRRCRLPWPTNSALVSMSQNGGRWGSCGVSANEYSCAHGAQINFGDLTPYLTNDRCLPDVRKANHQNVHRRRARDSGASGRTLTRTRESSRPPYKYDLIVQWCAKTIKWFYLCLGRTLYSSVAGPEPRVEEPKLNCLLTSQSRSLKITNCGSGSFLFTIDLIEKIMVAEDVFVNCYNFNPIT